MVMSNTPLLSRAAALHIHRAALFVQDAWTGLERIHPREGDRARRLWLCHLLLHWPVRAALLGLIVLTFFEPPAWMASVGPVALNATLYPVSGLPLLPPAWTVSVEAALLAVLVVVNAQPHVNKVCRACYGI